MEKLPEKYVERMTQMLGGEAVAFFAAMQKPARRGIRVNTLKASAEEFLRLSPFSLAPSQTLPEGFVLTEEYANIGAHPYHMAGLFYVQEPSAMAAIAALDARPDMRILDMCAAPGGKSGGIAARMQGGGLLVSNEIVPSRAKTLQHTLERLGVVNSAVTCAHPDAIAAALPNYFDAVLVDAPCSGEGMFRKDADAIAEWSPEHVEACAVRQRAILESAYASLAPGGRLVYSTCTFSREENENTVQAFALAHADIEIEHMQRLYPHTSLGEGHFVARMSKAGHGGLTQPPMKLAPCPKEVQRSLEAIFERLPEGNAALLTDGRVMLCGELPAGLARLRLLNAGVQAGELTNGRFKPAHALFMAAGAAAAQKVELPLGSVELERYFSGNTVDACGGASGWCAVTAGGFAVGLGKAVDGTLKNHLPKGLRKS